MIGGATYLFAFLDDHSRLMPGHRFGFAEDTVRLAAALRPALAARGSPTGSTSITAAAFVDSWLLRACGSLGIKLVHSTPGRPQGRGKIERFFRTVRDQFLVEITGRPPARTRRSRLDTSATWRAEHAVHRLGGNGLSPAFHSETGQPRWQRYRPRAPGPPSGPGQLREAFLWSERRKVTKTATVSLHGNAYQVDPMLVGRTWSCSSPRSTCSPSRSATTASPPGQRSRTSSPAMSHPKARPEQPGTPPPPVTGIDYPR